ncbi:hypothetical protein HMPREF2993_03510 [Corynebacterium sp. HMSC068G04]|nr:hypothetical protein HMPREF2993_03510 [Corynebacterium sp. HMSC068G04]
MVVDYLSSPPDWAGYQVSTKWGPVQKPPGVFFKITRARGAKAMRHQSFAGEARASFMTHCHVANHYKVHYVSCFGFGHILVKGYIEIA